MLHYTTPYRTPPHSALRQVSVATLFVTPQPEGHPDAVTILRVTFTQSQYGRMRPEYMLQSITQTPSNWFLSWGLAVFGAVLYFASTIASFATRPKGRFPVAITIDAILFAATMYVCMNLQKQAHACALTRTNSAFLVFFLLRTDEYRPYKVFADNGILANALRDGSEHKKVAAIATISDHIHETSNMMQYGGILIFMYRSAI